MPGSASTDPSTPTSVSVRTLDVRAIALDHENPEIDRVLFENRRFATVEKFFGAGARIAPSSHPRR